MAYAFDNMLEEAEYLKSLPYDTLLQILAKGEGGGMSLYRLFNVAAVAAQQKDAREAFDAAQAKKQAGQQAGSVVEGMITGQQEPSSQGSFAQNRPMSPGVPNVPSEMAAQPVPQQQPDQMPMAVAAYGGYAGNLPTVRMQGDPREWIPTTPQDRTRIAQMAARGGLPKGPSFGTGESLSGYDATQEGIVAAMAAKARRAKMLAALGQPLVGPYTSTSPYGAGARFAKEYDTANSGGYVNNLPTVRMQDPMWVPTPEAGFTAVPPDVDRPSPPPSAAALQREYSTLYGMLSQAIGAAGSAPEREELKQARDTLREGRELFLNDPTALSEYINYWGQRAESIVSPSVATTQLPPNVRGGTVALEPPVDQVAAPQSLVPQVYNERFDVDAPLTREQAALARAQTIAAQNAVAEQTATQPSAEEVVEVQDTLSLRPDFTSDIRRQGAERERLGSPVTGPFFGETDARPPFPRDAETITKEMREYFYPSGGPAQNVGSVQDWENIVRGPSGPNISGLINAGRDSIGNIPIPSFSHLPGQKTTGLDAPATVSADGRPVTVPPPVSVEDVGSAQDWGKIVQEPLGRLSGILSGATDVAGNIGRRALDSINFEGVASEIGSNINRLGKDIDRLPDFWPHADPSFHVEDTYGDVMGGDARPQPPKVRDLEALATGGLDVGGEFTPLHQPKSQDGEVAAVATMDEPVAADSVPTVDSVVRGELTYSPIFTNANGELRDKDSLDDNIVTYNEAINEVAAAGSGRISASITSKIPNVNLSAKNGENAKEIVTVENALNVVNELEGIDTQATKQSLLDRGFITNISDDVKDNFEKIQEDINTYASSDPAESTKDIIKRYQDRLTALEKDPLPFFRAAAAVMRGRQDGLVPFISAMTGFAEGKEELKKQMLPLIDKMTEIDIANSQLQAARDQSVMQLNVDLKKAMIAARQGEQQTELSILQIAQQDLASQRIFNANMARNATTAKGFMMQYLGTDNATLDRMISSLARDDGVASGLVYEVTKPDGTTSYEPTSAGWGQIIPMIRAMKETGASIYARNNALRQTGDSVQATITRIDGLWGDGRATGVSEMMKNRDFREWAAGEGYRIPEGEMFDPQGDPMDMEKAFKMWHLKNWTNFDLPAAQDDLAPYVDMWAPSGGGTPTGSVSDFDT